MLQSELFTKTIKEAPKDEVSINANLLTRAGFIYKNSAGIYSFLPLGWRVIQKIGSIIREEMNAIGAQEMFMTALHDKHYLQATGRWGVDVIGMTNVTEAKLAREAEICYSTLALITDYDVWHTSEATVSGDGVIKVLQGVTSLDELRRVIDLKE